MQVECVDEVLVEANELLAELLLIGNCRVALRETNAHRLLNKDHVREVGLESNQSLLRNNTEVTLTHV